jgi:hypothetical protein
MSFSELLCFPNFPFVRPNFHILDAMLHFRRAVANYVPLHSEVQAQLFQVESLKKK